MIPWFFTYDHTNYTRYTPAYWSEMVDVKNTHPEADFHFHMGEFTVQRSQDKAFSRIPIDQTIEQTVNRDSKTPGGIVGFSVSKSAVQRWILTSHEQASYTQCCRDLADLTSTEENVHKEASSTR